MTPDLDQWLPDPALRVVHCRESCASAYQLWAAAQVVRVSDAGLLGRLIRWRIPGTPGRLTFEELLRRPPFMVSDGEQDRALVCSLVWRIGTLRPEYPVLFEP